MPRHIKSTRSRQRAPAPEETAPKRFQSSALFVGSLEKGLRVLHAFDAERRPLRLAEVAAATGLDKSGAQRFTATLQALGYLRKDQFKRYRVTPKVLQLGFAYLQSETAIDNAVPFLQEAHVACEESVNFTQLDGVDVVWVVRLPSLHVVSVDMSVGARLPAFCTAPGRAILAHMPSEQALDILRRSKRPKLTTFTKTEIDALLEELAAIRRDGFAIANQETFLGDISTAAPVFDGVGEVVGAVNIAVPTSRWSLEDVRRRLSPLIRSTASSISSANGARSSTRAATRRGARAGRM